MEPTVQAARKMSDSVILDQSQKNIPKPKIDEMSIMPVKSFMQKKNLN